VTNAGALKCKKIIHVAGPVWNGGTQNEASLLKQATANSLKKANELGFRSIALTAISSGTYGVPNKLAAQMMLVAMEEFAKSRNVGTGDRGDSLEDIRITEEDDETLEAFESEMDKKHSTKKGSSYA